jgi:predicted secreted Zn-dependent protease
MDKHIFYEPFENQPISNFGCLLGVLLCWACCGTAGAQVLIGQLPPVIVPPASADVSGTAPLPTIWNGANDHQQGNPPAATPENSDSRAPSFAGVPNVTIEYYDVRGQSIKAIRKALRSSGLVDPREGTSGYAAQTRWHLGWYWPVKADGSCDLSKVTITFNATVILPRLVGSGKLDDSLVQNWNDFVLALREHEAGHVRHAYGGRFELTDVIQSSTCAMAQDAAEWVLQTLSAYDASYDSATQHGASQGAIFPPR